MAVTTTTSLSSLFNTIFEDALFVARETNIMVGLVRNFNARGWMARKIGIRPTLTAESVGEGVDYSNATEFTKTLLATLTPGEIITQVILTDQNVETDPDNARQDAAQEMGGAIGTKIDTDLVGDFANFTTDAGPGANSAATITDAAAGVSILRNAKAPQPIYAVFHPFHWHDLWVLLGSPAGTQAFLGDVANQALRDFYVGNWLNIQWFVNANIAVDANSDAVSGIFNRTAIGFDSRKAPMLEPQRDASLRAWELNFTAGYGHGVIRNTYGVKYTADATTPT